MLPPTPPPYQPPSSEPVRSPRRRLSKGDAIGVIAILLFVVGISTYAIVDWAQSNTIHNNLEAQRKSRAVEETAEVYLPPKNSQWTQAKYINKTKGESYPIYDVFPSDEELGKSDFGSSAITFEHRFVGQELFHENQDGSCKVADTRQVAGKSCKLVYQDDRMSIYLETFLDWDLKNHKNLYAWYVERGITQMAMSQSATDARSGDILARKLEFIKNLKPASQQDVDELMKAEEQRRSNK